MKKPSPAKPASTLIDERIRELGDWRGETLARVRAIIHAADPELVEAWKWMGTPVFSHDGIVCTGETYKKVVKLTFAKGASLPDPARLFNSSLDGNVRRAIDIPEGEKIDERALKALVHAAVALNLKGKGQAKTGGGTRAGRIPRSSTRPAAADAKPPVRLSGGNPQIAKADGDAPVQAYIAAMPGWKRDVGRRLDAIIVRTVPKVRKAVKWNSPFYGIEGRGWFLSLHVYARYVKVAFFRGAALRPLPPGPSKSKDVRYLDVREGDPLDEKLFARGVKQAAARPGWLA